VSGRSNGGISAKAARLNARLRSRISEFVLSSVFGLICVAHMKRGVLVLFDTNMATTRSYQLPSQPCGLPSDMVYILSWDQTPTPPRRSFGRWTDICESSHNAGLMDKCSTTSSFKILYQLRSDRFYIFFRCRVTAVVRLVV
jgi:hypothetical protein